MTQQRIKFVQQLDSNDTAYVATVQDDINTLAGGIPVVLDSGEDFRLIVADAMPEEEVANRLQQLISQLRSGQLVLDAALA